MEIEIERLLSPINGSQDGYLVEYQLLERICRVRRTKLKKSYTDRKLAQVLRWIQQGRGQGRREQYKPWIPITRGFSSPSSHMVFAALSIHKRNHHFLSKLEHDTALQLAYLGAIELRECLPLWPIEHLHPITEDRRERTRGLLDIAHEAGINHGNFVGSDVPYIASIDMLAGISWRGRIHHLGVSCKPDSIFKASVRAQERTKLDELYCKAIGTHHLRESGKGFEVTLVQNLATYRPTLNEIITWSGTSQLADFCESMNQPKDERPLHVCITQAGKAVGVAQTEASVLWRVGAWKHLIDINMAGRISMLQPIRRGKDETLRKLAMHFLGEEA